MSFWCREGQKENKVMQIKYSLLVLKRKIEAREEWGGGDALFKRMASEGLTETEVALRVKS